MQFKRHSELEGLHAFLSPSKYHWINYTDSKLEETYNKFQATFKGTELHFFASECIRLGIKLPKTKDTLNMYVNDGVGYKMQPEQPLYYSENCFGTTDAISFRKDFLRIHDYKSGAVPSSMHQLEVYTAIFCLEYRVRPEDIGIELRIYQNNMIEGYVPLSEDINTIMKKIVEFDIMINKLKDGNIV